MSERSDPPVRTFTPKDPDVIPLSALTGTVAPAEAPTALAPNEADANGGAVREIGGRKKGLDPTRYGDWEKDGRCIDF